MTKAELIRENLKLLDEIKRYKIIVDQLKKLVKFVEDLKNG